MIQLLSIGPGDLILMIALYYLGRHHGEISKTTVADHKAKLDKYLRMLIKTLRNS